MAFLYWEEQKAANILHQEAQRIAPHRTAPPPTSPPFGCAEKDQGHVWQEQRRIEVFALELSNGGLQQVSSLVQVIKPTSSTRKPRLVPSLSWCTVFERASHKPSS